MTLRSGVFSSGDNLIISLFPLIPKMSQPIPLRRRLRIKRPNIIIHDPRRFLIHVLPKRLSIKQWDVRLRVQGPVEIDADTREDFARGGGADEGVREAV